jgi:hypothetical protein
LWLKSIDGRFSSSVAVVVIDDLRQDFNGVDSREISRLSSEYRRMLDISLKYTFFFPFEYGFGEELVECE